MLRAAYEFDDRKPIGGVAYRTKPLSPVELVSTIEKILAEAPLFEAGVLYPYKVLRPLRLHRMEHFAIMSLLTRPQQGW
jgi:hypothetical protein